MTLAPRLFLAACVAVFLSVCTSADQTPELSRVMREKLARSQAILAAVITSDWASLDRESRALSLAARDPSWAAALTSPDRLRESDAFIDALQRLIEASARRDLEAAGKADVALTLSCVQCHLHMSRQRMAK